MAAPRWAGGLVALVAMTLEAWVKPSRRGTVRLKERGPRLSYGLYARPSAHVSPAPRRAPSLPLRRWSHLAMTWDGSVVRVYRDGAQVASHALAGAAPASDGPLRIGGNAIWPEFFKGVIDEVRVYDRALSATEIARDRDTRITPGGSAAAVEDLTRRHAARDAARRPPRDALALAVAAAASSAGGGAPRSG